MKHYRLLLTGLFSLGLVFLLSSCDKQSYSDTQQEVSFNINNVTNIVKKGVAPNVYDLPRCSDDAPAYIEIIIDGKVYLLDVLSGLNDGTETQVLKLDAPATHTISSFKVFNTDSLMIWTAPMSDSYYAKLWKLKGLNLEFDVFPFKKNKIDVDVLCWDPYKYEDFGFDWFDFEKVKVKTMCFFGDVCVEDFEAWHEGGSIYYGQQYDGFDFAAIFDVYITNELGDTVNDINLNNNLYYPDGGLWQGLGSPLCIEYPDFVDVEDNYFLTVNLFKPDGSIINIVENRPFKAEEDAEIITGDDGIYDFEYGICTSDDGGDGGCDLDHEHDDSCGGSSGDDNHDGDCDLDHDHDDSCGGSSGDDTHDDDNDDDNDHDDHHKK